MFENDEAASQLGEAALVSHISPISQSKLIFYNIPIDENAANHIALGETFRFFTKECEAKSNAEFAAAGENQSPVHVDFTIGSGDMDVDGLTVGGVAEPVMRNVEWAFDL